MNCPFHTFQQIPNDHHLTTKAPRVRRSARRTKGFGFLLLLVKKPVAGTSGGMSRMRDYEIPGGTLLTGWLWRKAGSVAPGEGGRDLNVSGLQPGERWQGGGSHAGKWWSNSWSEVRRLLLRRAWRQVGGSPLYASQPAATAARSRRVRSAFRARCGRSSPLDSSSPQRMRHRAAAPVLPVLSKAEGCGAERRRAAGQVFADCKISDGAGV
jgi:hypothetical protein